MFIKYFYVVCSQKSLIDRSPIDTMEFAFATTQPWFPHTQISNPCYTAQRISWGKNCFKKQLFIYSHVSTNLCVGFMFRLTSCPSIFHVFREACELDWRVHSKASCACFGKDQKDWQALCKTPAGSRHWQEQGGLFSISFILVLEAPWDANVDESGFSLSACREYRQLSCKSTSPFPSFDVLSIVESGCIWNTSGKYRKIKLPIGKPSTEQEPTPFDWPSEPRNLGSPSDSLDDSESASCDRETSSDPDPSPSDVSSYRHAAAGGRIWSVSSS